MDNVTFIVGGARSGKSTYAVELAKKHSGKVIFIATAIAFDEEMKTRIAAHKISRPAHWDVIEEPKDLLHVIKQLSEKDLGENSLVLIDCMGLFVSNLMFDNLSDEEIMFQFENLFETVKKINNPIIFVSNEVGLGIVPANETARRFRDLMGSANQKISRQSNTVIFMQFGIPVYLKGEELDS